MKKIFILLPLLALILTVSSCGNVDISNNNDVAAYCAETSDTGAQEASSYTYDISAVTPEMLIGTWILESQDTPLSVMERAVILESGIKLLYTDAGNVLPFFWHVYDNVLTSILAEFSHPMPIRITADGLLVFTYEDGLTATYAMSDLVLPERIIMSELVGTWYLVDQRGDAIIPETVEFLQDGSGRVHYDTGHLRYFEWGVTYDVVLFKDFEDTQSLELPFIIDVAFIEEMDGYAFSITFDNGIRALYFNENMMQRN